LRRAKRRRGRPRDLAEGAPLSLPPAPQAALAPAKVNLYLDVLRRRPDGYHDLETLFLALPWGDDVEVRLTETPGVSLEVTGDVAVPAGDENLAVRAARAYLEAAGKDVGVAIRLAKRIPVGAGLGGGSSDAGTTIRLLERLLVATDEAQRIEVAQALGADVPFFLRGGAAVGRGRGDEITLLPPPPPVAILLILPPFGTETARVYEGAARKLRPPPVGGLAAAIEALASGEPKRIRSAHYNALAGAALTAYPDLRRFATEVERRLGRPPCLSGSGSTLYDVPDPRGLEEVLERLEGLPGRRRLVRA
jgi:4-diphosphocytidyl-2-C-methyl-D-erythritol kinase